MNASILVIEDDQDLCDELREILEAEGYKVTLAHTGPDGLRLAMLPGHDLVLLDLKLPECSGVHILETLKKHDLSPPILVMTGSPISSDLPDRDKMPDEARILGMSDGIISKPFDVGELLEAIRDLT